MSYLPRIRTVNALPATHEGRQMVLLQDPLGIAKKSVLIPPEITPLLMLCDGTRNIEEIHADLHSLYGFNIPVDEITAWLDLFNDAALLKNKDFHVQKAQALKSFREQEFRPMTLADDIYSSDAQKLAQELDPYLSHSVSGVHQESYAGMICPHIDYFRGWRVYAEVMAQGRQSIRESDLLIILGTDHFDDGNPISLTTQHYKTPYGILSTPMDLVSQLEHAVKEIDMFDGELRHRYEHSIELALVWLHHMRDGKSCDVLPILCGSHDLFYKEDMQSEDVWVEKFISTLRGIIGGQKTFIVAAADLAHVGIAFGGERIPHTQRSGIALADEKLLQRVKEVDPNAFIGEIATVNDRYNVCGITPIYLLLKLLEPSRGSVVGYELCPADQDETSWVSICGALIR